MEREIKEVVNSMVGRKIKAVNRQIDNKKYKQVLVDAGYHQLLKIKAAKEKRTIKELVEGCIAELLAVENDS